MNNNLDTLNQVLFEQLNRLSDRNLKSDKLRKEIERTTCIEKISKQIIESCYLRLKALQIRDDSLRADTDMPKMFSLDEEINHENKK